MRGKHVFFLPLLFLSFSRICLGRTVNNHNMFQYQFLLWYKLLFNLAKLKLAGGRLGLIFFKQNQSQRKASKKKTITAFAPLQLAVCH